MFNTPIPRGRCAAPASQSPSTCLVAPGNWYALDASGPIVISGAPEFDSFGYVEFSALGDQRAEVALREIERSLRWMRAAGIKADLAG